MEEKIKGIFNEAIYTLQNSRDLFIDKIMALSKECAKRIRMGGKIIIMGNGGSAADSLHWAGELVGRFLKMRKAIPAISLCTNPSVITAISNDMGFEEVFARQLEALAKEDDVIFAISTSGLSPNIVNALKSISRLRCYKVGFTGRTPSPLTSLVDISFEVPSRKTPRIQEVHELLGHIICEMIESELYDEK